MVFYQFSLDLSDEVIHISYIEEISFFFIIPCGLHASGGNYLLFTVRTVKDGEEKKRDSDRCLERAFHFSKWALVHI